MTDPYAVMASTFYREAATAMSREAVELLPDMPDSSRYVSELAAVALVASYQELNPHDAPDVPWCICRTCQGWLFRLRWERVGGAFDYRAERS